MKILRAIKTSILTQGYGLSNTISSVLPLYNSLGLIGHDGWDWGVVCQDNSVKTGGKCENVYYDVDIRGTIIYIQKSIEKGFGITIETNDKDGKFKHLWWHFDSINPLLKVGDTVESGDLLGVAGNTGTSKGAHLHRGLYDNITPYTNGYYGAVSVEPYFENVFILDKINLMYKLIEILKKIISLFQK